MQDGRRDCQVTLWRSERHNEYHFRQYQEPYRSTVHLAGCVRSWLDRTDHPYRALDVGCGAGANIYHLSEVLPETRWVGVDLAIDLLASGRHLIGKLGRPRHVWFVGADFYQLTRLLPTRHFDLLFSIQTLSWLPSYEGLLRDLLLMLKPGGWAFVTSLFTDFLVDARIEVSQLSGPTFEAEGPFYYNVYSFERFRAFSMGLGADAVYAEDFAMDQDLEAPPHRHMGTYTRLLSTGERLQFSGPLAMPWKVVAIRMAKT